MVRLRSIDDQILSVRQWMTWRPKEEFLIGDDLRAVLCCLESMMYEQRESAEAQTRSMRLLAVAVSEVTAERDALRVELAAARAGR